MASNFELCLVYPAQIGQIFVDMSHQLPGAYQSARHLEAHKADLVVLQLELAASTRTNKYLLDS